MSDRIGLVVFTGEMEGGALWAERGREWGGVGWGIMWLWMMMCWVGAGAILGGGCVEGRGGAEMRIFDFLVSTVCNGYGDGGIETVVQKCGFWMGEMLAGYTMPFSFSFFFFARTDKRLRFL